MSDEIKPVERREATSAQTDFTPARVLRDTSRTHIVAVAHFIKEKPEEDCVTLYKRQPPDAEPIVIRLTHPELDEFVDYVGESVQLRSATTGRHLLLSMEGELSQVSADPESVAKALGKALQNENVRDFIQEVELDRAMAEAITARSRLHEVELAIDELEGYLDEGPHTEQTYQEWLQRHAWAFGMTYLPPDDVRTITRSDQVDFLLPVTMTGHRDVAELKRPDHEVLSWDKAHQNWFFSRDASMGIGQCHRYLEKLQDVQDVGLQDEPDIFISYPRAMLVIGRSHDWGEGQRRALDGLNARLHGIRVVTYDHLLAQAKRFLALVKGDDPAGVASPASDEDPFAGPAPPPDWATTPPPPPSDDDVPF